MDPFEQLYQRSFPKVYRYLLGLCGDSELAEELTAETFYRAWLHFDQFQGKSSIDTWLCQIGRNAWLSHLRRVKRTLPLEEGVQLPQERPLWEGAEDRDAARQLHWALHRLPEPYREVFSLKVFAELKFSEIAQLFGKSVSWAKMTYYRARQRLLAQLEEGEG